ncbi:MAG: prepilin-type N-terminal cleavage/methylation domain-containing protein [Alphaproteobacteria bacterium]|nr:prepilin-type N-terminal cleavage/methylation domain-containing protein [Alphaproteobacteria bacterium]
MQKGFSLVELSIVLVILGLLTGGILAGQSLIRASELRAITTEFQRYQAATHTFRDKYFALPGDMANATAFWLKDNAACAAHTGTAGTPGTCNGNGSGSLQYPTALSTTGETVQFWRHLSLAGLIEGNYTGLAGPVAGADSVIGTNVPRSRLNNAGWGTASDPANPGSADTYAYNYGNNFRFGAQNPGFQPSTAILTPSEAWNIDTKMDDGMPGQGKVFARFWSTCANSTTLSDYTGTYRLDQTGILCSLFFLHAY